MATSTEIRMKAQELQEEAERLLDEADRIDLVDDLKGIPKEILDYFSNQFEFNSGMDDQRAVGASVFSDWICSSVKACALSVPYSDCVTFSMGPFSAKFNRKELIEGLQAIEQESSNHSESDEFFECESVVRFEPHH